MTGIIWCPECDARISAYLNATTRTAKLRTIQAYDAHRDTEHRMPGRPRKAA